MKRMCKLCNLQVKDGDGWSQLYVPKKYEGYYHLQCVKQLQPKNISSTQEGTSK